MEQIRLKRIVVNKLFDRFTYDIDLENGNDVAIFIAPNGCGKTTIFNLVDFIFKPTQGKMKFVRKTPFESCTCILSNEVKISLVKRDNPNAIDNALEQAHHSRFGMMKFNRTPLGAFRDLYLVINDGESHELNLDETLLYSDEDDTNIADRVNRFLLEEEQKVMVRNEDGYYFKDSEEDDLLTRAEEFIRKYECNIDVNYITADRLHKPIQTIKDRRRTDIETRKYDGTINNPLETIKGNFAALYNDMDNKYNRLVSEARDSLPRMYLNVDDNKGIPPYEEFAKEWDEYVNEMERYAEIGLMNGTKQILKLPDLEASYKKKGAFLSVYLNAFKDTLKPWREHYDRLKLFIDILNGRNQITLKELKYSPKGLILLADGRPISLECMSSGEKNDLIMFYNLIFNSQNGGLVLVDEPEISLHIQWQEEYMDRLLSICKMNHLQAIVATHSPNIVNGHFELYADRRLIDGRKGN